MTDNKEDIRQKRQAVSDIQSRLNMSTSSKSREVRSIKRNLVSAKEELSALLKQVNNLVEEANTFAFLAEKCVDEESTIGSATAVIPLEVGNDDTTPWKTMDPKDKGTQLDTVLQVTDYGPALAILRGKLSTPSNWLTRLRNYILEGSHISRLQVIESRGQQGGGEDFSDLKYYHNPLTSFYFLFRELSWRLSEPDRDDYHDCVRLSQILIKCMESINNLTNTKIKMAYIYLHDLEKYFLYFDIKKRYSQCEHYFIKDIMSVVRGVYLDRPAEAVETYYILDPEIIKKIEIVSTKYDEQININLEMMSLIVEYVKKFEEYMDVLDKSARAVNTTVVSVNKRKNTLTNRKKFGFSPKNISYIRGVAPNTLAREAPAAAAAGGSRNKTKSKRRHNRKTKKRKNV